MRNMNGYGTVKKLSGNRRNPYGAYITTGYEMATVPKIAFLKDFLDDDLYNIVEEKRQAYIKKLKPNARQKQKAIGYYRTRQEAMIALAKYNESPYDLNCATFSEVYNIIYERDISKKSKNSQRAYKSAYDKCTTLHNMALKDIRTAQLQKIIDENAHMSMQSLTNLKTLFMSVFKYAMEYDLIQKDYSKFVKLSSEQQTKEKTVFSKEEINALWESKDQFARYILILIYTGMRISEFLALKKEDIHLEERYIEVKGTKTKAANRIVPIHTKIIPLVKDLEINTGYQTFRGRFKEKFPEHTIHETRHTFISAGTSMNRILLQQMVGHSTGDVTGDVYTHIHIQNLVNEIDKLDI